MALGERGRNPLEPRSTAEGACAMRAAGALERDLAVRCPDDMAADFLGGLNVTTLAKHRAMRGLVLRRANRRIPGAYTYEIMRAKFIDEIVLGGVAAGLDELILLGAGLDSRPYRLAEQLRGVRVIEVDHPASQASKRARLCRLLGREPDHVTFVKIDFTRDDLDAALAAAGHERSARTLFIWSGVSPYLPEEAVAGVLSWVGGHGSPRTSIVFDACWAEVIDGSREYFGAAELRRHVAKTGEPLRWGIPEGRVRETLSSFGLQAERSLDSEEGRIAYLKRSDGTLHDQPFGFGVLVHARAADSRAR
ncbi:MAG TPA: SAM-dependent methyltransferase [Solirubrobacteraceae bacterium]|nr:SAM-dependent methyltransferase [Solirubrobacteraceae bacterium]